MGRAQRLPRSTWNNDCIFYKNVTLEPSKVIFLAIPAQSSHLQNEPNVPYLTVNINARKEVWFRTWVGWDAQMALCARERRLHDLLATMPLLAPIKCCEHPNSTLFLGILTSVGASTIILILMTRSASLRQFNKWNRSRETTTMTATTTTAF